jgi:hypothetical protein
MAAVVDELKGRLVEMTARLEAIRAEAVGLEAQKQAFETVIACYDPEFRPGFPTDPRRRTSRDRSTPTKRVTDLLRNRNPRHITLDILREADGPVAATYVAQRFVAQEKLDDAAEGLNSHLTSRFATILDGLHKQELVRFKLAGDVGNRRLWEINR